MTDELDMGDEPAPAVLEVMKHAQRHAVDSHNAGLEPPVIPSKPASRARADRTPPSSLEAEEHVIAVSLLDGGDSLDRATSEGLDANSFYSPACRLIFGLLLSLRSDKKDISLEVLAEELKSKRQLATIGGIGYLMAVTARAPTTAHAGYFIQKVRDLAIRRELIRISTGLTEEVYTSTDDVEQVLSSLRNQIEKISTSTKEKLPAPKPISAFKYPSGSDPNILLGNDDYLGRGGGLLFISHAGAGKSSWIMDACMMWALGNAWMGIKCGMPLKTLIIQAEDSDRYVGKIFASFAHVNQLTSEQVEQVGKNCVIVRLKGVAGPDFERALEKLATEHKPDLVVINPVYLYAAGDITRSEFAQPFLVGLDRVNKAEKFAYILIHHTGKPAKQQNGKKAELDDWESAYQGFGSSYFANWPRCTALLEPLAGEENKGRYFIKLGKGGLNAGVTREVQQGAGIRHEITTKIPIRHSQQRMPVDGTDKPVYYWEMDEYPSGEKAESGHKGRIEKYTYNDYRNLFPTKDSQGLPLGELHKRMETNLPIPKPTLHNVLKRWIDDGHIEALNPVGLPMRYRAAF